ncbi:RING finger protein nhl-1 isoform X1 [Topomyia yanbarensis]|uniref:RING finger protein nhl-1 isoform X1 n=1 Tax=Topomyia yanbarensis TaxID=2498891 RepID=UPI00273C9729|nr:RING finger protein nhl-1 isoform X1 [Topomyia yanbarensis]XP_058837759.1 RING finger protein nhl-1 isoform X1 [Topomyia yanbarensis]XP_058837760.1 RING finger protein nhl-1 isoform X1 [Topomyia yanbarensis]XP_058837762.1 RING finger protein nhl-1 isoform X1 [Topomyia yanbarensis]
MEQFEQLLTCCVCLDRYRNPKLLPCQHSFCMEPCMDGLIDYVKRQVKCPECRAEHRIPYQGVQGFPTNVTLQRFLELHIEITGELPDPTSGQVMERCNVCSEKAYCTQCVHCDKKICPDCKSAHMDILRREINRINNQIRRGLHRLKEVLAVVEKNTQNLQNNCGSVSEEIDEISRRLQKALKDRTDHLRGEMDKYLSTELKNVVTMKENLELEIANIQSNSDLAEKYMNEGSVEWDDCELMDTKEIFLRTVDFIRNFDCETMDYSRKVRFIMNIDPNKLIMEVSSYGDLKLPSDVVGTSQSQSMLLQPPSGPGLMRSKSDHRLAAQFRQQEAQGWNADEEPLLGGRRFGERPVKPPPEKEKYGNESRYGRGNDYDYDDEPASRSTKGRFRSRFARSHQLDNDSDNESKQVRFNEKDEKTNKVSSTEDVAKGPLSGIFRLMDSPRVMKRLQDTEKGKTKKASPATTPTMPKPSPFAAAKPKVTTARQLSEDDEIAKIKRQNKGASTSTTTTVTPTPTSPVATEPERPAAERVSALKGRVSSTPAATASDDSDSTPSSPVRRSSPQVEADSDQDETERSSRTRQSSAIKSGTPAPQSKKPARSDSSESNSSSGESSSTSPVPSSPARVEEPKPKASILKNAEPARNTASPTTNSTPERKPFQSRFLPQTQPTPPSAKKEESESSSEEETSSEEESDEEEEEEVVKPTPKPTPTVTSPSIRSEQPSSPLFSRIQAREAAAIDSKRNSREEPRSSGYSSPTSYRNNYDRDESPKYGSSTSSALRSRTTAHVEPEENKYGSSGYTSRFLNKSKSTAVVAPEDDATGDDSDSRSNRSRFTALQDRRNRLARSRSSHNFGNDEEDDEPVSPTTSSPSAYLASRYGASSSLASQPADLSRSRSTHALKSREPSPDRSTGSDKDGAALSSWARYLKNKYGNRSTKDSKETPSSSLSNTSSSLATPSTSSATSSAAARRLSLGLPLRQTDILSSDDDSKNGVGSPTSPTAAAVGIPGAAGMSPRTQYLQKRRQLFQIGGRGSEPGSFTWPRGIAVGPDNSIVVADSSNHRVQVFDSNGIFVKEFGQYGNGDGEFDCLAGVAVNRIGQFIIADRYNHRIQVLDPAGRFLRSFGTQGTADGKFNYPWGITTDALGFIYVCDKENHRIQVFQSDGTFIGKFGSCGKEEGQLEHPHYIAVSNTNRVVVSDSNNHRIQIFDVNGRVVTTFGGEGSDEGQFKFPRGVAVDDQGYICVADSGNNRIQIFHPDGSFLRAFGSWGSGDAEFKGLEGVAIMSNGNILVCDRENHRVQVF